MLRFRLLLGDSAGYVFSIYFIVQSSCNNVTCTYWGEMFNDKTGFFKRKLPTIAYRYLLSYIILPKGLLRGPILGIVVNSQHLASKHM